MSEQTLEQEITKSVSDIADSMHQASKSPHLNDLAKELIECGIRRGLNLAVRRLNSEFFRMTNALVPGRY